MQFYILDYTGWARCPFSRLPEKNQTFLQFKPAQRAKPDNPANQADLNKVTCYL